MAILTRMSVRTMSLVLGVGVALGVAARLVDGIAPRWVGDMTAVWVFAAFWAGSRAPDKRRGAFAGVACLVVACASYYLWRIWVEDWMWALFLATVGTFWLIASIAMGAISGAFGAVSHRASEAWAIVAGAFVGEAAAVWLLSGDVSTQVVLELTVGAGVVLAVGVRRRQLVALTVAASLVIGAIGVTYRVGLSLGRMVRQYADSGRGFD
jgi:hypothetical protein